MAADIGKVYPTEIHLLSKEIEIQGELISLEKTERQTEIEELRKELNQVKQVIERSLPVEPQENQKNFFQYQPGFIVGKWSPWVRILSTLSGVTLIHAGIRRKGSIGLLSSSFGVALISRAITNEDLTQLVGTVILPVLRMKRSLYVAAPIEFVYDFLKDFSNYPKFMSFIREVSVDDVGTLTWIAQAPGGTQIHWRTTVQALQQNQRIAWKSIPGSLIATEGIIQMAPTHFGTQLHIQLSYAPPAGAFGYAIAHLLGFDPKSRIDGDLKLLNHLIIEYVSNKTTLTRSAIF